VDEDVETLSAEDGTQADEAAVDREHRFTQRELVRASLLRCPPPTEPAAQPPR
jgi:hypothetical protein